MPEPEAPAKPAKAAAPLKLDSRAFTYDDLVAAKATLDAADLVMQLRDGREVVRANAALGLAAINRPSPELLPFLRDRELHVATASAEALLKLGVANREYIATIAAALDGARPPVIAIVEKMFAQLIGIADAEVIGALDTNSEVVANSIVGACAEVGVRGLHLLQGATRDERTRVRINALRGIAQIGDLEMESSIKALTTSGERDGVADVRAAARNAYTALRAKRTYTISAKRKAEGPVAPAVPEFVERALTAAELKSAAAKVQLDELLIALEHPRIHVRENALRVLAEQGAPHPRAIAVLLRDPELSVRTEAARTLATLGVAALVVAPELVAAPGEAAEAAIVGLGESAKPALIAGLDTTDDECGVRAARLLGKLAGGPQALTDALASTSLEVRIHAATGLAGVRAPNARRALGIAALASNARLRAAAIRALAVLDPKPDREPPRISIAGFYERALAETDLAGAKDPAALIANLASANPIVRANAATALGAFDEPTAVAVCLRDDDPAVRLAAARAIDKMGPKAVAATIIDLIGAARGPLTEQITRMLGAHKDPAIDEALIQNLADTCELVCTLPQAADLLTAAFARSPKHATRGFILLGRDKLGKGRAVLEEARKNGEPQLRELARTALIAIDGPPPAPKLPAGFETKLLDKPAELPARDLLAFVQHGNPIVRANAATSLGDPATLASMLRDDDVRVRIAAARALDRLGDAAVTAAAPDLVGAMRGDPEIADVCSAVLASRGAKVEAALVAGLETADEQHGTRIVTLICALPNAIETLFIAFDGPAQNIQINAAIGIGMLGIKKVGRPGWLRLRHGMAGPFTRRREVMVKALAMLGPEPESK